LLIYEKLWECSTVFINTYQLPLTNPQDMLHHGKRAANKGGCSVWLNLRLN